MAEDCIITILIIPAAFLIEYFAGGIKYRFHPLNIMGRVAVLLEKLFYRFSGSFFSGLSFNLSFIVGTLAIFSIIFLLLLKISFVICALFSTFLFSSFLSTGGLKYEGRKIFLQLKSGDIKDARQSLMSLAGRDADGLNPSGISRAVIESVAENSGDGTGSVLFFYILGISLAYLLGRNHYAVLIFGGTAGVVAYKSSNLLDSLVGYRNERYEKFGKFSARLDDLLNFVPFRLTAFCMMLSVMLLSFRSNINSRRTPGSISITGSIKSYLKFRKLHPSPNAGQVESIMAGALRIKLGGVNYYGGKASERPVLGYKNYAEPQPGHIVYALKIMTLTSAIMVFLVLAVNSLLLLR